ncbi:MAG TPA: Clp protease N-terminal domain-containing protein, partial [Nitrolancea sp.]|nr:Clp protease N-terminal domain-containing protein [Nitrolancea sp.]
MTAEARASLLAAERVASRTGSELVAVEHLLLGLLDPPSVPLRLLLATLRIDTAQIVAMLSATIAALGTERVLVVGFDENVVEALELAAREATSTAGAPIDSRHLLLAALALPGTFTGMRLRDLGLTADAIRNELHLRGRAPTTGVRSLLRAIRPSPLFLAIVSVMALSGAGLALFPDVVGARPLLAIFLISGWVIQMCVHEFGHAAAAYLGGDREVVSQGYLTLDPRRYSHPLLSVVLPLVFLFLGGLPLPGGAVMINHAALRSRKWDVIVAAAGPAGTLLCLLLISLPFLVTGDFLAYGQSFYLSSAAAGLGMIFAAVLILNLLPIPPLDGFQIIGHWLPDETRQQAY